jgi:hypothetical protein
LGRTIPEMRPTSDRPWLDWLAAVPLAVLAFNVHVATEGDALSAMDRPDRRVLYGAVLIVQVVLLVRAWSSSAGRGAPTSTVTAALGAATSLTALMLDVQDGPVRTVQLLFLLGLFAVVAAIARAVARSPQETNDDSVAPPTPTPV